MKKFISTAIVALILAAPVCQAAPDITDLLRGLAGGSGQSSESNDNSTGSSIASGLEGLVKGLISNKNIEEKDIVGSWKYVQPAVAFQSENFLQKAGGAAAAGVITGKLAPYYAKVGIDKMTATFNEDLTFTFQLSRIKLTGTFALDSTETASPGDFILSFKAAGKIPLGQFRAHIEKQGSNITITFDASKLISLVNSIATISKKSSIQTVASLLNQYDGLDCGFELAPATR